ncbi:hypothetical protein [Pseudomonas frederiksbergensis]|uniref:Uncharacterized protein n=1 Tax=Pseudomonas frederiksbergensis TaxID=104087 RepID=A0AB33E6M4_9PSED|nr:hypothetical protein [Pseudomonas frederiksbergensis]ATE74887.1 hypothetical protein CNN82_00160 [Pseudomonas frederiksbergensis]
MLMLIANWGSPCQLQFELGALLIPDLVIRYPAVKLNESVSVFNRRDSCHWVNAQSAIIFKPYLAKIYLP